MITSILDNDFYKFTMQHVVYKKYADVFVTYEFKERTNSVPLGKYIQEINDAITLLNGLSIKQDELVYLSKLGIFDEAYLNYLSNYRMDTKYIHTQNNNGELSIVIVGPWLETILFEVPLLSIVNEIWFKHETDYNKLKNEGISRLNKKIDIIKNELDIINEDINYKLVDFGTRRRYSFNWQSYVVKELNKKLPSEIFKGTSNVLFAKEGHISPIGTMAHEFMQAHQVLGGGLESFQPRALQAWADVYRGKLGIALSDTVGFKAFLDGFDLYFCKLYDGLRQDSGDPFEWGQKFIKHYQDLGIDPKTKTMVFSDGLDIPTTIEIYKKFNHQAKLVFGVGTNLTNDLGVRPLQIVIKMTECNHRPVAKISDSAGKEMCKNQEYVRYLKHLFKIG